MIEKLVNISPTVDILATPAEPDHITNKDSQLLYGETFVVEEERGAYVYGHNEIDGYRGCVSRENLARNVPEENAVVSNLAAHLYPAPNMKMRPELSLSFMSRLNVTTELKKGFYKTHDNLWIYKNHIILKKTLPLKQDIANLASMFLNVPYLYGGRSSFGIDCAGLVQVCLLALNHDKPARDSCDQTKTLGTKIEKSDIKRNDLVFFEGHVGIMLDDKNLLNATARHMKTVIEPLKNVEKSYDGITNIVRL